LTLAQPLEQIIATLKPFELVISDRLHGGLIALIMRKKGDLVRRKSIRMLVRNDVKNKGVVRTLIRNMRDLDRAVNSRLRLLQKNPDNVRAFFQMDTTRYAAAA